VARAMTGPRSDGLVPACARASGLGVRGGVGAGVTRPCAVRMLDGECGWACGAAGEGDEEAVWSRRVEGRRECTAGARIKMALKGSEGLARSGIVRPASNDSSWAAGQRWALG
jgi:hypothetical protein